MADFPGRRFEMPVIASNRDLQPWLYVNTTASAAWETANRAVLWPFTLAAPYLVKKVWWYNGSTASGNVDCGVYSPGGALLLSCGSTAQAGVSAVQSVTLGTATLLQPGAYYMALAMNGTTGTVTKYALAAARITQMMGQTQVATNFPLATGVTMATDTAIFGYIFGIASAAVI